MSISASLCRDQCTDRNTSGRVAAVADEPHHVLRLGQSESTKAAARCEKLSKLKRRILATVDLPWRKSRKNRLEQGSDRRTFIFGDTWIPLGPITKCRKPKINLTFVPTTSIHSAVSIEYRLVIERRILGTYCVWRNMTTTSFVNNSMSKVCRF